MDVVLVDLGLGDGFKIFVYEFGFVELLKVSSVRVLYVGVV